MRIAVTGATGLIGRHLAAELRRQGHEVVPVSRRSDPPVDVMDPARIRSRIDGCDMVYHLAAKVGAGAPRAEYRVNVVGTRNVVEAAELAGVGRLVHMSTLAVMGEDRRHVGTDESRRLPDDLPDEYSRTKAEGERIALDLERRVPVVVLRAGWVWGPDDPATVELFAMVRRGTYRYIGDGGNLTYLTHIDNVVGLLAHLATVEPFPDGEVFNVTDGDRRTMRQFVEAVADALHVEAPGGGVPRRVALMAAAMYGLLPGTHALTRQNVDIHSNDLYFPVDKARRMLGYDPSVDYRAQIDRAARLLKATEPVTHAAGR
jgi:nucleoside-diphosphate-sugar epimerase